MKRASAPGYDLLKTIVTVLLVLLLLPMLLSGCAGNAVPQAGTIASPVSTEADLASDPTETLAPSPVPPTVKSKATPATAALSPTPTTKQSAADSPAPTAASAAKEPPAPTQDISCNTRVPSRLSVGQRARVVQRLNMRSDASITAAILQTNLSGTQVEIIGGPVCTPAGKRAYLWWQIRLADGAEGWSVESQLNQPSYFLEPVK